MFSHSLHMIFQQCSEDEIITLSVMTKLKLEELEDAPSSQSKFLLLILPSGSFTTAI